MKKNHFLLLMAAFTYVISLSSCTPDPVPNPNPNVTTNTRDVGNYSKLINYTSGEVFLNQEPYKPLRIEGDSAIVTLLETFVTNDTLIIRFKPSSHIFSHDSLKIYASVPKLIYAQLTGSGGITGTNDFVYTEPVTYVLNGSGNIKAGLTTTRFTGTLRGSGNIEIKSGQTTDKDIAIFGSGNVKADNFVSQNTTVSIPGSGAAYVNAQQKLNVTIQGTGSVFYRGNPQITKTITGTGAVIKLN